MARSSNLIGLATWLAQLTCSVLWLGSFSIWCSVSCPGSFNQSGRSSLMARTTLIAQSLPMARPIGRLGHHFWLVLDSYPVVSYGSIWITDLSGRDGSISVHVQSRPTGSYSSSAQSIIPGSFPGYGRSRGLARSPHVGIQSLLLARSLGVRRLFVWLDLYLCAVLFNASIRFHWSVISHCLDPVTCPVSLYVSISSHAQSRSLARCPYVRSPSLGLTRISLRGHRNLVRTMSLLSPHALARSPMMPSSYCLARSYFCSVPITGSLTLLARSLPMTRSLPMFSRQPRLDPIICSVACCGSIPYSARSLDMARS
jgi:hypothetical protein